MPPETTSFTASSTDMSMKITSSRGQNSRKPDVGFGVVGTKTLTMSMSIRRATSAFVPPVTKPITHSPRRGYSTSTTSRKASDWVEMTVSRICLLAP